MRYARAQSKHLFFISTNRKHLSAASFFKSCFISLKIMLKTDHIFSSTRETKYLRQVITNYNSNSRVPIINIHEQEIYESVLY